MKILDIPQSGKRGLNVSQGGRYGQISRALVIPTNPRTADQLTVREHLSNIAAAWRGLTEVQRSAWTAEAKNHNCKSRLGQSGALTGDLLFIKVNCNLLQCGMEQVIDPPAATAFPPLAVQGFTITNSGGAIALKLTCPGDPGDYTIVRASSPRSAGRLVCSDYRFLGMAPTATQGQSVITTLYTAKFGVPAVGKKVYVRVNQIKDGYESAPREYVAIVPASS